MSRWGRRQVLAAGGGVAVTGLLAACGVGGAPNGGSDGGTGELRATWWGGDSENTVVKAALDKFTEERGQTVLREALPWDGYWDKLATQTAARNAPDVVMQAGSRIPDYADRGALVDLTQVESVDTEVVDEGLRKFGAVDDKVYGVVAAANAMGVAVNDQLAEQAGVALPDGDYTWEQLGDLAEQAHKSLGNDRWGLGDAGGDLISLVLAVRDSGREFYTDDGVLNATADDVRTWLEMWETWRQAGAVPPPDVTAEGSGSEGLDPMSRGNVVFQTTWTQDYVGFTTVLDTPVSLGLTPHNAQHPSLWMNAASLWSISATSGQQDVAGELINFLLTDDDAIRAIGVGLGAPPTQHARDLLADDLEPATRTAVDYMEVVGANSRPLNRLWPKGFNAIRNKLADLNEAVAFGKSSVPDAVSAFMAEAEANA